VLTVVVVVRSPIEPNSIQAIERGSNEVAFTRPTPVEVVINTTSEQDQTLGASQHGSLIDVEGQLCEKPIRPTALNDDVENDVESPTQVP
jgi:hypothetical protein